MRSTDPIIRTASAELASLLQSEPARLLKGTPRREQRGQKHYWYDMFRLGTSVCKTYLGEDCGPLADAIAADQAGKPARNARSAARSRLVRLIHSAGARPLDPAQAALLAALDDAGVFAAGALLIGPAAFALHRANLGLPCAPQPGPLHLLLPGPTAIAPTFRHLRFSPEDNLLIWQQNPAHPALALLAPVTSPQEEIRPLPGLGHPVQTRHYTALLTAAPAPLALPHRDGRLIPAPGPADLVLYTLLQTERAPDQPGAAEARVEAMALAAHLPTPLLKAATEAAMARGRPWRRFLTAALSRPTL